MVFGECCDYPYENIGFDTPSFEGGALVYFITKEQNRKCHIYVKDWAGGTPGPT